MDKYILYDIFIYLTKPSDFLKCMLVCRKWYNTIISKESRDIRCLYDLFTNISDDVDINEDIWLVLYEYCDSIGHIDPCDTIAYLFDRSDKNIMNEITYKIDDIEICSLMNDQDVTNYCLFLSTSLCCNNHNVYKVFIDRYKDILLQHKSIYDIVGHATIESESLDNIQYIISMRTLDSDTYMDLLKSFASIYADTPEHNRICRYMISELAYYTNDVEDIIEVCFEYDMLFSNIDVIIHILNTFNVPFEDIIDDKNVLYHYWYEFVDDFRDKIFDMYDVSKDERRWY